MRLGSRVCRSDRRRSSGRYGVAAGQRKVYSMGIWSRLGCRVAMVCTSRLGLNVYVYQEY